MNSATVAGTQQVVPVADGEVRLAVREWPGGDPPLLLLHGLASSSHIWDFVAPRLSPEFRVAAYDARGHGLSGKPASGYGFETVAGDAVDLLSRLRMRRPVLVGHSWGASVALEAAVRHPRRIAGLVLVDGGFWRLGDEMDWKTAKAQLTPPPLKETPVAEFRKMLRKYIGDSLKMTPEMEDVFLSYMRLDARGRIHPQLTLARHMRIVRAIWEEDCPALLAKVRVPTLLLLARDESPDESGFAKSKEMAARRARKIGDPVRVEWINGIHDIPLQRPAAVAGRIRRFVNSLRS